MSYKQAAGDGLVQFEFEKLEVAICGSNGNEYVVILEAIFADGDKHAYNVKQYHWPYREYTLAEDALIKLDVNPKMYLIVYEFNYRDEFNVEGFELLNEVNYNLYREIARAYFEQRNNVPFEMFFGTNESIELTNADIDGMFLGIPISLRDASIIQHLIGKHAGVSSILSHTVDQIEEQVIDFAFYELKQKAQFGDKNDLLNWIKKYVDRE